MTVEEMKRRKTELGFSWNRYQIVPVYHWERYRSIQRNNQKTKI